MSKKRKTVDWVEFATTAYFAEKVGLATREEEVWMENMDWKYAELNPGRLTGANSSVIQDICESMLQGHPIHKPLLARLPSEKCFPVDGFRRSRAAKEAEQKSIQADVIVGVVGENGITMNVLRDLSVQCNRNGGLGIGREEAMVYAIDYVERLGYSRDRALEAALLPKGCKTNLSRKLLARKMVGDLVAYDVVEVLKIPETTLTAFMRVKGNMVILGECVKKEWDRWKMEVAAERCPLHQKERTKFIRFFHNALEVFRSTENLKKIGIEEKEYEIYKQEWIEFKRKGDRLFSA